MDSLVRQAKTHVHGSDNSCIFSTDPPGLNLPLRLSGEYAKMMQTYTLKQGSDNSSIPPFFVCKADTF
ncbi:hypothetical protein ABKN59_005564 [Abortiporus biennis]